MKPYYQDDYVTIYNCDCRDILGELPKVDLVLTDPPYGITNKTKRGAQRSPHKYKIRSENWDYKPGKKTIDSVLKMSDISMIWGGNYFADILPVVNSWFFWHKRQPLDNYADGELCWNNLKNIHLKYIDYAYYGNIGQDIDRQHPTQKPIKLMRWCIVQAGNPRTILDPFAGSCTTGRAAKDMSRKCICIELEEKYCEIGAKRMCQEVMNFNM